MSAAEVPAVVTLHLWGIAATGVPGALVRMGTQRRGLSRTPGLGFAKLLGTGHGRTFTVGDADPLHWGLLATWDSAHAARRFDSSPTIASWDRESRERLVVTMRPLSSRGCWSGRLPFGNPSPQDVQGPVAALTRARIVVRKSPTFWRSVPPVAAELRSCAGVRLALGLGEAPVLLQGTFSVWDSAASMSDFAHRGAAHSTAIRSTREQNWYAEELFARFAVIGLSGTYRGVQP